MSESFILPKKRYFTLREACDLKGLNYKSSCNRTFLQPNGGTPDALVGGRKVFKYETIFSWIELGDDQLSMKGSSK